MRTGGWEGVKGRCEDREMSIRLEKTGRKRERILTAIHHPNM